MVNLCFGFLYAEPSKMLPFAPAKLPSDQRGAAQPLFSIFTCSHSTKFKKPIFKAHETTQMSPPLLNPETLCPKQAIQNIPSEIKRKSKNPPTNSPSCESETPSSSDKEEDNSIFFTPELFEGEKNLDSPQKQNSEWTPRFGPKTESSPPLSEELFRSDQDRRSAIPLDGQGSFSVRKELSQKQGEQKPDEKAGGHEAQSRQTRKRLHRLSRSRPRSPLNQAGTTKLNTK